MTARAEYTAEEWDLLRVAPQAVVGAVAFADGAGLLESVGEAIMAAVTQARGKERFPGNELIAALVDDKERMDPARLPQPQEIGEDPESVRRRLHELALDTCREVAALLADRSNQREAAGYATWVMEIAKTAATTARHRDGLFGEKGPRVGPQERTVLEEIGEALGVDVGDLPIEPIGSVSTGPVDVPSSTGASMTPAPDTVRPSRNGKGPDIPSGPINPS